MNPIKTFFKRFPQIPFWLIAWSTFAYGWFMFAKSGAFFWAFLMWGPFLGGILITAVVDGRSGLKTYFSRIVRWRVGLKWYAIAIFFPLILRLIAVGFNIIAGAKLSTNIQWITLPDLMFELVFATFFTALGEEPGFRGFALPRMLVGRSALMAALVIGVLHTIWHLPLFITGDDPPLTTALIIISGSVLFTWLFNNTKGSVLIAMLLHISVDIWQVVFKPVFNGADAQGQEIWLAVSYIVMAVLLRVFAGRELGRKPEAAMDTQVAEQPAMAS